jgi:hypothetical protein
MFVDVSYKLSSYKKLEKKSDLLLYYLFLLLFYNTVINTVFLIR